MLYATLQFKDVFPRFALWDRAFNEYVQSEEDWEKVSHVCSLLHIFEGATKIVSGSQYPTSNLFLSKLKRVKELIDKKVGDSNLYMRDMANAMKENFDKYWGESNLMMSIGVVIDSRFKLKLLSYCFPVIYPLEGQSEQKLANLNAVLHDLYQEYVAEDSKIKGLTPDSSQISSSDKYNCSDDKEIPAGMSEYAAFIRESGAALEPVKSELDDYLSEGIFILDESSAK
ncbi:zinc finger BED domain-containing protein RICESLEEPER 2-like [Apium graveolens]|uniref:zinc finger BED domain-containing protein RICESLEEPER 2-like n=1 Tax=Apium graveolens TaxID=4045 RepID=UPI003D7A7DC3